MIITDDEAKSLKSWIIKKLEDISDADSDVLADYVLALIRAESPEPEVRANAIENLDDFLHDHTTSFVDEIFRVVQTKSYLPGYTGAPAALAAPQLPSPIATGSFNIATGPSGGRSNGPPAQNRKRSYNDAHGGGPANGSLPYGHEGRQMKHTRRGVPGMSNGHRAGSAGRQHQNQPPLVPGMPLTTGPDGQPMPNLPMDRDTISQFLALGQAMGFPPIPGVPAAGSPPNAGPSPGQGAAQRPSSAGKTRIDARCRDYDTKGFCLRGVSCPFSHGDNQVVIPSQSQEYDPKNGLIDFAAFQVQGTNGHTESFRGRGSRGRGDFRGDLHSTRGAPSGGQWGGRFRAEFSQTGPNHDRSRSTVVVEQIPEENFDEGQVRAFFESFGPVESVEMRPYKRLAIVKFAGYDAARAAYESPRVVFDNRFVKVYWYNPERLPTAGGAPGAVNGSAGVTNGPGRPGSASAGSPTTPASAAQPEEPAFDAQKFARDAEAAQKRLEERRAAQKAHEEKRAELEKQREAIERKQAEEKKKLLDKLKAKGVTPPDGGTETSNKAGNDGKRPASATTEALRAKVRELEAEAKGMGLDPDQLSADASAPYGRGRGGFRGRGRGSFRGAFRGRGAYRGGGAAGGAFNLDNRPKTVRIEVTAPDNAKDESLRQFLFSIGEPASITTNPERTAMTVAFRDRFTAEKLFFAPRDVPGVGTVEMTWLPNAAAPVTPPTTTTTPSATAPARKGDKDGDTAMGGVHVAPAPNGTAAAEGRREGGGRDDEYDVADEDDGWVQ